MANLLNRHGTWEIVKRLVKGELTLASLVGREDTLEEEVSKIAERVRVNTLALRVLDIEVMERDAAILKKLATVADTVTNITENMLTKQEAGDTYYTKEQINEMLEEIDASGTLVNLIKTTDTTEPSDENAYSALRSDATFLRKDQDDTTPYSLTVEKVLTAVDEAVMKGGARFGDEFIEGLSGTGALIDASGNATLERLLVRTSIKVPVQFNRIMVAQGLTWHAIGGGLIKSVEIDKDAEGNNLTTGTITLDLAKEEEGRIAVNDLCMGIMHDYEGVNENATEDYDSRTGNFKIAGSATVYFKVTDLLDSDKSKFRYELREVSDTWSAQNHPRPQMVFATYANSSNADRQQSTCETAQYLVSLEHLSDWEWEGSNIYYLRGKLDGFSPDGTELEGNGVYVGNVNFGGTLEKILNAPFYMVIDTQGDQFIAPNDTKPYCVTCRVYKGGIWDERTEQVSTWTIERDSGDETSDAVWNAEHKDFAGYIELWYDDLGTNYSSPSTRYDITAQGEGYLLRYTLEVY